MGYNYSIIHSVIPLFTHSVGYSFSCSFIRMVIPLFNRSFIHSFIHLVILYQFCYSFSHPSGYSFIWIFLYSCFHSFAYFFINSITHSFGYSFRRSVISLLVHLALPVFIWLSFHSFIHLVIDSQVCTLTISSVADVINTSPAVTYVRSTSPVRAPECPPVVLPGLSRCTEFLSPLSHNLRIQFTHRHHERHRCPDINSSERNGRSALCSYLYV